MYCKHCGTALNEGVRFCPQCGNINAEIITTKDKASGNSNRIASILSLILSAFPFLMFWIPIQITTGSYWADGGYLIIDGYDSFLQRDMLSIWWGPGTDAISIVNVLILAFSLLLLIANSVYLLKGTGSKTLNSISAFCSAFFSLLYCIEGIILVALCPSWWEPVTFSYFALILVSFIIVAKLFLSIKLRKDS